MSYNYYSSYPSASTYSKAASSSAGLDGIIAALGAFFVILLIFCIAAAILTLVGQWKMFKKAGKEGYIALIPVYNVWKRCWNRSFINFLPICNVPCIRSW